MKYENMSTETLEALKAELNIVMGVFDSMTGFEVLSASMDIFGKILEIDRVLRDRFRVMLADQAAYINKFAR